MTAGLDLENERADVAAEDLDQAAVILVFDTADTATENEELAGIAAGVSDASADGNTVWGIDSSVSNSEVLEQAIEGCVPST